MQNNDYLFQKLRDFADPPLTHDYNISDIDDNAIEEFLREYKIEKPYCNCEGGLQGGTVDKDWEQFCDVCGGYS